MDKPMKKIADQKLKAFTIGSMGNRSLSKREVEELKKKEQEKAAAQVFEEFVATFENTPNSKVNKTWIKAGTYDAGKRQEDAKDKGKIYRPQPKVEVEKNSAQRAEEYAKQLEKKDKSKKKKEPEKKKTNLELFKEELKLIQEEREERHKYKGAVKSVLEEQDSPVPKNILLMDDPKMGSYDTGDPNTTNLYLGNLNPKITEQELMELFGKYGPLASIKIMWPRSDEEKARGRNCGFVAYMSRKDGERALRCLNGKDVMQYEMKLGWGKGVPIPSFPIYIPPKMLALTIPPPPCGLPFNAQPTGRDKHRVPKKKAKEIYTPEEEEKIRKIAQNSVVKVVVPTDRNVLILIHHMIEFVIREGPMFEAMIMHRELKNPLFTFLFKNDDPNHVYYRWKLYSMLQGDGPKEWRIEEFYMFKGGSVWRPPPINPFSNGMPDELFDDEVDIRKGSLSITQRERLEDLLRHITPERNKIAEAMIFCVEHVDAIEEICDCILEALCTSTTVLYKKVARLYLVSDILNNCLNKITNASYFRIAFESRLGKIFEEARKTYENTENSELASCYRCRLLQILKQWSDSCVYPKEFVKKLENIFLGQSFVDDMSDISEPEESESKEITNQAEDTDDLDGAPLSENGEEDLDGVPLDGAALLKAMKQNTSSNVDDIDGVPLNDDDIDGIPLDDDGLNQTKSKTLDRSSAFVPCKWESVDPQEAAAQAMTTSKWELLEQQTATSPNSLNASTQDTDSPQHDDMSRSPSPALNITSNTVNNNNTTNNNNNNAGELSSNENERRAKLREVEVKVMQYQDELESGKRGLKPGATVPEQVEHYRRKLLRKIEKQKLEKKERENEKQSSSCEEYNTPNVRSTKRSRSPKSPPSKRYSRSRSRSPAYKSHKSWSPSKGPKRRTSPSPKRKRRLSPESPVQRSRYRDSPSSRSPPRGNKHRSRRSESYSPGPSSSHHRRHSRGYSPSSPSSPSLRRHRHKYKR